MERRVRGNPHARCGVGERPEIISGAYLSLFYLDLSDFSDIPLDARAEQEEIRRLMYVSMTRARDQLFVTGVFSKTGKTVGEEILNWCLHEAYEAAELDWDADFTQAKAAAEARKAKAAAKRAENKLNTPSKRGKRTGHVSGQASLF